MNRIYSLLIIILISIMFSSCNKDSENFVPPVTEPAVMAQSIDTLAIKAQLSAVSVPSKEKVQEKIAENSLKSANVVTSLSRIFSLDSSTYEVYDNYAVKHLVYYEVDKSAHVKKLLTLNQNFPVNNGIVDTTQYYLDIQVGCPFNRYFLFKDQNYISQVTVFFHLKNGEEFSYFLENNFGSVKLPPIANARLQVSVTYDDGDVRQSFYSRFINFYVDEFIGLNFDMIQESNLVLKINKSFLGVVSNPSTIELVGKDSDGNFQYFLCPINLDGFGDIVSLSIPFYLTRIYICGDDESYAYSMLNVIPVYNMATGEITYRL